MAVKKTGEFMGVEEKQKVAFEKLSKEFGYKNAMAAPHLVKVSVSVATGSAMKRDKKRNEVVMDRISKITGQKPTLRKAKKAVASFKTRIGDEIGVAVTIRGARMYGFLDKLLNVSLPRTKDFRGVSRRSVDDIGNITFGIKEHIIFPEIKDEELKDVFGLAITIVTTAKTKPEATKFFEIIGVPFKAEEGNKK
ncbi:MAG: ribosomal protein large subunit ribosomal protein [Candidatus Nomurabacteria bacterium]|nr:ribosomal protein large subunit ribosomal protein [Candidatus Nomurabacteria bacterium]